jgi:sugar/nucleoside kinase (ribokinase family)
MTYPGAMADLGVADIPADLMRRTRHLHVSSIFLQRGLAPDLADWLAARPAGVTASLDPGWDPDQSWTAVKPLLAVLDWMLPNSNECLAIAASLASKSGMSIVEAAETIAAAGPSVVVKLGAAGALLVPAGGAPPLRMHSIERTPVDTTGAGDNFNAGFLAAMLAGRPAAEPATAVDQSSGSDLATALAQGCACGAISTGGLGGTGRLADPSEAAALTAEILRRHSAGVDTRSLQEPARAIPDSKQLLGHTDLEYR